MRGVAGDSPTHHSPTNLHSPTHARQLIRTILHPPTIRKHSLFDVGFVRTSHVGASTCGFHPQSLESRFCSLLGFEETRLINGPELFMTDCWANVMGEGTEHTFHQHNRSTISGTYYVQTPKKCSSLLFEDPRLDRQGLKKVQFGFEPFQYFNHFLIWYIVVIYIE